MSLRFLRRHQTPVPLVDFRELSSGSGREKSESISTRVTEARNFQAARFHKSRHPGNAALSPREVKVHCQLGAESAGISNTRWRKRTFPHAPMIASSGWRARWRISSARNTFARPTSWRRSDTAHWTGRCLPDLANFVSRSRFQARKSSSDCGKSANHSFDMSRSHASIPGVDDGRGTSPAPCRVDPLDFRASGVARCQHALQGRLRPPP